MLRATTHAHMHCRHVCVLVRVSGASACVLCALRVCVRGTELRKRALFAHFAFAFSFVSKYMKSIGWPKASSRIVFVDSRTTLTHSHMNSLLAVLASLENAKWVGETHLRIIWLCALCVWMTLCMSQRARGAIIII